jgi:hypothetical protein
MHAVRLKIAGSKPDKVNNLPNLSVPLKGLVPAVTGRLVLAVAGRLL